MRMGFWIGTGSAAGVAAIVGLFALQPPAQAIDESQATAVACQRSLEAWSALSSGTPAPSRGIAEDALDEAIRCGHQPTLEDRRLVGQG